MNNFVLYWQNKVWKTNLSFPSPYSPSPYSPSKIFSQVLQKLLDLLENENKLYHHFHVQFVLQHLVENIGVIVEEEGCRRLAQVVVFILLYHAHMEMCFLDLA